jgi:hypothetical protein
MNGEKYLFKFVIPFTKASFRQVSFLAFNTLSIPIFRLQHSDAAFLHDLCKHPSNFGNVKYVAYSFVSKEKFKIASLNCGSFKFKVN